MRLAHVPLESVARKIAAESPLPSGERRIEGYAFGFDFDEGLGFDLSVFSCATASLLER